MKTTYLLLAFCLYVTFGNAQTESTKIVEDFIENFNKKDVKATLGALHSNFKEYWQSSLINKDKSDFADFLSWAAIMDEKEEIEIVNVTSKKVTVISTYHSSLDKVVDNKPYKCKKTYVLSKGKIVKILNTKNGDYDKYQKERKAAFTPFSKYLMNKHKLKRTDFEIVKSDALKMKDIVSEFVTNKETLVNRD